MGTTDLTNTKSNGTVVDADDVNDVVSALAGDFVGRDGSSKAVASSQRLGTPTYPWGTAYIGALVVAGSTIDFDTLGGGIPNTIISGATRTDSIKSDFIRAAGSSAQFTLLATTTNLALNIDSTATTFSADVAVSSLTTAPGSNNTCLVNESLFSDQDETKYAGEDGTILNIDTAGTEITSRVGEFICLKGATEYMLAYVKSSTELSNVYRGFFYDSSGNAIDREPLTNNDTLTIMSLGWVFAENNGTTVDVSYTSPIYDYTEPSSPATGDYWFDMQNQTWKRYSGSAFVQINRILVGCCVIDSTNCVAARSFEFDKTIFRSDALQLRYVSATQIQTVESDFNLGVYGNVVVNRKIPFTWDITADLESGQVEGVSTTYYAYISEVGEPVLSETPPYNQVGELGGWYHPHQSWRCLGWIENDSSSDFDSDEIFDFSPHFKKVETLSASGSNYTWFKPLGKYNFEIIAVGGGGEYASSGISQGKDTTFGSTITAGGGDHAGGTGGGGSATGGYLNVPGIDGNFGDVAGDSHFGMGGNPPTGYGGGGLSADHGSGGTGGGGGATVFAHEVFTGEFAIDIAVGRGGAGGGGGADGGDGIMIIKY